MRFGYSYDWGKKEITEILKSIKPQGSSALDIGAGCGTYWNWLGSYYQMDAIEVFEPYVKDADLKNKYNNVYISDIRDFIFTHFYDLIIMGDILEHLSVKDAQQILEKCKLNCDYLMVAVPYRLSQGELYGNKYEIHLQSDLTPQNFNERYPGFIRVLADRRYGYYIWRLI